MNRVSIILALLIGLASGLAQGKEWYFYNVDGSQVSQPLCDSLVTIRFAETTDTLFMNDLPSMTPGLQYGYSPVSKANGFWQYRVSTGYDVDTLLANLRSSPYIDYVTPTFEVTTGSVWYVYDELLIAFREEVSQQEIDSIVDAFSLDIVLEPDSLQDSYLMRITASSPPDIFDIGNEIYESGLCYYSYPNRSGVDEFYWYPDDDYFYQQWPLYHDSTTPGKAGADIDMQEAWEYATGSPYIIVAVIDNAFDIDH
jgi:hypothetical protein